MEIVEEIKQAVEYTKQKKYKDAESIYLRLLKSYPDNHSVISFLGLLYYQQKKYKKSEKYLEKSYNASPSQEIALYLGIINHHFEHYYAAIFYLRKAIKTHKTLETFNLLLESYNRYRKYPQEAYEYAIEANKSYPLSVSIMYWLISFTIEIGKFNEAENYVKRLYILNPKSQSFWYFCGLLSEVLYFNYEKALECYKKISQLGDKYLGYINMSIMYMKLKNYKKAYYYLKKAYKIDSGKRDSNYLLATYYLSRRKFKKGYKYYVKDAFFLKNFERLKRPWDSKKYSNETLFVYGDQGFGDELQYSRYFPYLEKKFKRINIMVSPSLIDLFKRSFKNYKKLRFYTTNLKFPRYDKSLILSNIPYYLNKNFNQIPSSSSYLIADEKRIEKYNIQYFSNKNKLKVGICWESGGVSLRDALQRSINVDVLKDIINMAKISCYSLQVKPSMQNYKNYSQLVDLGSTFKSFDDTAAALKNLDVFITVDTSVLHLAGALGVKTFLLLPYFSEWRWFDNTEKTEWYDSVKIFKQTERDNWDKEIEKIVLELTKLA